MFFFELDVNLNGMCMCVRRIKRVREKYEAELRDLERSERAALQKQQEMREKHSEMEAELLRLQSLLRQARAGNKRPHPGNRRYGGTVWFVHTH